MIALSSETLDRPELKIRLEEVQVGAVKVPFLVLLPGSFPAGHLGVRCER